MVNPARGEVALEVNGVAMPMRLTLGGLAELEARLSVASLVALAERFESGAVSAGDLLALLGVGLRGAGATITDRDLAEAEIGGGALGALKAGIALMARSFENSGGALVDGG
jgi:hypothetical protein